MAKEPMELAILLLKQIKEAGLIDNFMDIQEC